MSNVKNQPLPSNYHILGVHAVYIYQRIYPVNMGAISMAQGFLTLVVCQLKALRGLVPRIPLIGEQAFPSIVSTKEILLLALGACHILSTHDPKRKSKVCSAHHLVILVYQYVCIYIYIFTYTLFFGEDDDGRYVGL